MTLVSVTEYANANNKDPGNIRRLLASGRMSGRKIGNQWVIDSSCIYPKDRRVITGKYVNWRKKKVLSLEELKTIIQPIVKKYDAKSAMLFGSYARGEATAHSDIDLYVIGGRKFDKTDIFSIADDLYSATGKNVDVYESKEIDKKSALYSSIVKEGIKLV